MANKEFKKWATGYSGGDGGNLKAPVWIFGIEHGAPGDRKERFTFSEADTLPHWPTERDEFLRYLNQYNTKVVKLLSVLEGLPLTDYRTFAWERQVFCPESAYFKWNLFPLPLKTISPTEWDAVWVERTGLPSRNSYQQWCREHRFPVIQSWFETHQPELVIGTGLSFRADFARAFGYDPDSFTTHDVKGVVGVKVYTQGRLVVIPFLGRPLNSHKKLFAVGEFLIEHRKRLKSPLNSILLNRVTT